MNKKIFLSILLLVSILFYACESPAGTTNDTGDTGDTGDQVSDLPTKLILFDTNHDFSNGGNLGGRTGADSIASAAKPSGTTTAHAFISVDASDSIANMPTNYGFPSDVPIVSPDGTQIAANWSDLLDGTIDTSLNSANVTDIQGAWVSGSNSDGTFNSVGSCVGWTSGSSGDQTRMGATNVTDAAWIDSFDSSCTLGSHRLLFGVAY